MLVKKTDSDRRSEWREGGSLGQYREEEQRNI